MKCPKCRSEMFVREEDTNSRSHVTFYRCSLCANEQVSSAPVIDSMVEEFAVYFEAQTAERKRYLMA